MDTRQRLLSAAQRLFAHQGYDSATIEQIARSAGVTKGAVYYFFDTKAELFCTIMDEGIAYIEAQCEKILEAACGECGIADQFISFLTGLAYENANLFLILFGSRSADPGIQRLFEQRSRRLLACTRRMIFMGQENHQLREMDPDILTRVFAGIIYGVVALPDPPDCAEAVQTIRRLLSGGIFAGPAEEGKDDDPSFV